MRILINDHAGHPFQVQLSRSLAKRGHQVLHTYCALLQTPRGALAYKESDPNNFEIHGISLKREFSRYSMLTRVIQEWELGKKMVEEIANFRPDVVISANTPLGTQSAILNKCKQNNIKFVFWVQDLLGEGIAKNIQKKLPIGGDIVGWYYKRHEESLLKKSDEVVVITEDFCPMIKNLGVADDKVHVIHNWAPLDEIPVCSKSNHWSKNHGLHDKFCLLYSGTLGMKHNPELIVKLAVKLKDYLDICLVVVTEGLGMEFLMAKKETMGLDNLVLMPFQPFEDLPLMLGSADILIAILEPDAGVFAVPSKVLTYLCTQRPLLMSVPGENLAARIVIKHKAGVVVDPSESQKFVDASVSLYENSKLRQSMADNGRNYAQKTFDIATITDKFEAILSR